MPKIQRHRRRRRSASSSQPPSKLTTSEVAQVLGVTKRRIQQLAAAGTLRGVRQVPASSPRGKGVEWLFDINDLAKRLSVPMEELEALVNKVPPERAMRRALRASQGGDE